MFCLLQWPFVISCLQQSKETRWKYLFVFDISWVESKTGIGDENEDKLLDN